MIKKILIGLSLSLPALAAANPDLLKSTLLAQPSCGNFVRFDDKNLYLGFGGYRRGLEEPRQAIPGRVRVAPVDATDPFELATRDAALDILTEGVTAYVLTYSGIEEWDLETRERRALHSVYAINGPLAYKQHAEGFARYKDKLIIAHGRLGVSFFDLKKKRVTNQFRLLKRQLPLESMAVGVTIQGEKAFVVMDNFHVTRPGDGIKIFRGFVVIDMKTETVVAELDGMDPGADAVLSDTKNVIVSFGGMPIWKYRLSSLQSQKLPEPVLRVWRYPLKGHPTGLASMDERHYYTCYLKAPTYPGENGGSYTRVPFVIDRAVMMLD